MNQDSEKKQTKNGAPMRGEFTTSDDAWLESLLRTDARQWVHIDDHGFSARVMSALPVMRKPVTRWLVPAMAAAGGAVAMGLTPAGGYFATHFLGLFDLRHFSLANLDVLVPVVVMYICSFTAVRER